MKNPIKFSDEQKANIERVKVATIEKVRAGIIGLVIGVIGLFFLNIFFDNYKLIFRSPILVNFQVPLLVEKRQAVKKADKPLLKPLSVEKVKKTSGATRQIWQGIASFYSRGAGCLGCSVNQIKANGEKLDDNKLSIAFNQLPIGRKVEVCNTQNEKCVVASVDDTGGFEKEQCPNCCSGRGCIADLTLAVRNAIGSTGNTDVKITAID